MKNYMIAFHLPEGIDGKIKNVYREVFKKEIPISNLHLTLLPPFSLREIDPSELNEKLSTVVSKMFTVTLGRPRIFKNKHKNNLYVEVNPKNEVEDYYKELKQNFKDLIKFDTSVYEGKKLPQFLPHISLDYDFTFSEDKLGLIGKRFPKEDFKLLGPAIYIEKSPEMWVKFVESPQNP